MFSSVRSYTFIHRTICLTVILIELLLCLQRIYIALPEEKARAHMFKVHLGDTPHTLTQQDYTELAQHTEGFSGSDIAVVVKDVLMEPVRQTQDAFFFRWVMVCLSLV